VSIDFTLLRPLGWGNDFTSQLPLEQLESLRPARVVGVERTRYRVDTGHAVHTAVLSGHYRHTHTESTELPTVGDWVLLAHDEELIVDRLKRRSLISRKAVGAPEIQPIAANVDLLLIVSALGEEYNLHRIERYLVIAAQAGVTPLVLLTKADLYPESAAPIEEVRSQLPLQGDVMAIDALHAPLAQRLSPWLNPGATIALVGSSGVGKSTVVNNLSGTSMQRTQATRRDEKGRHTTTSRSLYRLPGEVCIVDVPGMREVGLAPSEGGVGQQFHAIELLARRCRFADCTHQEEPGCAVREAVASGELSQDTWQHYLKLLAEERHNISEHERRRQGRTFGKMVREVKSVKQKSGKR
jgi:ribosome biogenesis GTPase